MNKCLRLLLCSFMRSWIISTVQSGEFFTLGVMGTAEIYVVFGLLEEQVAMRSVLLLVFLRKVSFCLEKES